MAASDSALLNLPPEIRCMIYKFVFAGVQLRIPKPIRRPPRKRDPNAKLRTSIVRTCRQCCTEAMPILYSTVAIHPESARALLRFKERVGLGNYQRISNLITDQYLLRASSRCTNELANLTGLRYLTIHFGTFTAGTIAADHGIPTWSTRTRERMPVGPNFKKSLLDQARRSWRRISFPQPIEEVHRGLVVSYCMTVNTDASLVKKFRFICDLNIGTVEETERHEPWD